MKYSRVLVALSAAACSYAQEGDYASGLLEALQSLDLTALLDVLPSADPSLISALREGEHTVFAPSNAAFDAAGDTFPDITNLLQYHVTAGAIDDSELTRDDMVYRTLLSDSPAVMLRKYSTQFFTLRFENDPFGCASLQQQETRPRLFLSISWRMKRFK